MEHGTLYREMQVSAQWQSLQQQLPGLIVDLMILRFGST
jgi:hypothetical protein